MEKSVSDSRFFMWRTLFAVAHADNIVTSEEIEFMAHVLEDINFSDYQTRILKNDIMNAQDPIVMFKGIDDQDDRIKFFEFARDLVWVDGDFGSEEQSVMIKLGGIHSKETDINDLVGRTGLELEEDEPIRVQVEEESRGLVTVIDNFRNRFMKWFSAD